MSEDQDRPPLSAYIPPPDDLLAGEGLAEVDLQRTDADPATARHRDGAVVEGMLELG
jgi:hypothetical protein